MNRAIVCAVAAFAVVAVSSATHAAPAAFPLEPGEAFATCGIARNLTPPPPPFVAGVIDVRDPGCDATAALGLNWLAPMSHNELPNPTMSATDEWTDANLGPVFGLELDDAVPPNIYLAASSAYGDFPVTGRIFQIDGTTGAVRQFATLPNPSGAGLGQLAWDPDQQQLFATNMEDGATYRVDATGTVLDRFDPFAPDDGVEGFSPRGERLWALAWEDGRLYFSLWVEDYNHPDPLRGNEVWSVGIDPATGALLGADTTLEILVPPLPLQEFSCPIADLSFSGDGRLALAERTMKEDSGPSAHYSRVLEYSGAHLAWAPTTGAYLLGELPERTNSAGGLDWDCAAQDACNTGRRLWAMGDALRFTLAPAYFVYGLQGTPDGGGDFTTSYLIDLNGSTALPIDKTYLGDVDIYRPRCRAAAKAGPDIARCPAVTTLLDGSASTLSGCAGLTEYRWLQGATEIRGWSSDPTVTVAPTATTSYTLELRCAGASCGCASQDSVTVTVNSPPGAALSPLGTACANTAVMLDAGASAANGCSGTLEYQFRDGASLLQAWGPSPVHGPFPAGASTTYTVEVRCSLWPACVDSASAPLAVVPEPVAVAGPDLAVCQGSVDSLDASGSSGPACPGGLVYEWWEGAIRLAGPSPAPTWSPPTMTLGTRTYTLRVACAGLAGCAADDDVVVTVRDCSVAVAFGAHAATLDLDGSGATIEWTTLTEKDTLGFAVERARAASGPFDVVVATEEATGPASRYRVRDETTAGGLFGAWYRVVELGSAGRGDRTPPFAAETAGTPPAAGTRKRRAGRSR